MKLSLALLFVFMIGHVALAQVDEMQLVNDVAKYQEQLKAAQIPDRDAAEKELIALGDVALDFLEDPTGGEPADYLERFARIRKALEKIAVQRAAEPSTVKIKSGKHKLAHLLVLIQKQTGNQVVLGRNASAKKAELQIDVQSGDEDGKLLFWELLQQIIEQADLELDPYGGRTQQLALANRVRPAPKDGVVAEPIKIPDLSDQAGVLHFNINRIDSIRNIANPQLNSGAIAMTLHWEPRLQPIAIDMPMSKFKMLDEFGQEHAPENREAVFPGFVTPDVPELEFNIRTPLFDRQIEKLAHVKGVVQAVLPGRMETFKFRDIKNVPSGTAKTRAGATVKVLQVAKNEDLWGIRIQLKFDEANNALESHQAWVADNPMFLLDAEDEKIEFLGVTVHGQQESFVDVEYFFNRDPVNTEMHYTTPAAIVKVEIPFTIEGIPLP